jgi:hypothetical protein
MPIGKVFHYTPLVDDLDAAERFFTTFFAPHCFYRGYSPHWNRSAAMYAISEFIVEPMQPHPPVPPAPASSWYRFMERNGPRVLNIGFYATDLPSLAEAFDRHGIRTTAAGNAATLFTHPKDFPGVLEFFDSGAAGLPDPRRGATWNSDYWRTVHPLGLEHPSHITVVVRDRARAAALYTGALGSVELPEQPSRIEGARSTFVTVGPEVVIELAEPVDPDCPLAADLDEVGESICGMTFAVGDLTRALDHLTKNNAPVVTCADGTIQLDRAETFGSDYAFTDRPLIGDPRTWR